MKISRRDLAGVLAAPAAAQAPLDSKPEEELEAAGKQIAANRDSLRKRKVPMATEPSFSFRP